MKNTVTKCSYILLRKDERRFKIWHIQVRAYLIFIEGRVPISNILRMSLLKISKWLKEMEQFPIPYRHDLVPAICADICGPEHLYFKRISTDIDWNRVLKFRNTSSTSFPTFYHILNMIIDFSINGLSTENWLRSQRTTAPYKIKVHNCKLVDLVIRIELTRYFLIPRFPNFLRNSSIYFRIFLYLATCFLRVTVSLLYRLHAVSKTQVAIYTHLISEGRRNCSTLWPAQQRNRDSFETCRLT